MILTVHRWFANKACPGDWLYSRLGDLAARVTAKLQPEIYRVRKTWADIRSQKGAYSKLSGAKKRADSFPGHSVFDREGNRLYTSVPFRVRVSVSDLEIRTDPGNTYAPTGHMPGKGVFTVCAVHNGWLKLKSGAGWIPLSGCAIL